MNSLRDPHPVVDLRGEISCYDSNGNLTTDENNYRFVYDAWNKVVQVKNSSNVVIVTYGRDALYRHVTDTVGSTVTDRFFSTDWQLLETKVGSNTVTRNVWSPVYIDGLVLRDRDTDGNGTLDERLYLLQDANWNTTALVNSTGTVQERYTYTPFGQVTFRDASGSTLSGSAKDWVFLHQGGERIAAGDCEFRNQVYSPSLGRWLSNDPLGFEAGDQNWYRTIGNNPGNGVDPSGLLDPGIGITIVVTHPEIGGALIPYIPHIAVAGAAFGTGWYAGDKWVGPWLADKWFPNDPNPLPKKRTVPQPIRASFTFVELLWNEKMAKQKVFSGKSLCTFIRSLLYRRSSFAGTEWRK